ncbi:MAG TPA: FCD domain-containing protein [Acidimicrobiales bacterium]|nr:FCD domain-containing protein [Acidimicrobiales bacterium]
MVDTEDVDMTDSTRAARRATRPTKVPEWLARQIVRDIADQKLPRGSVLPSESEAIVRYGVSRASLREALRLLQEHGLIAIKPGPRGGPVVAEVTSVDFARMATFFFHVKGVNVETLVEARILIDPLMARLAAERQDPAALRTIRELLEQQGNREGWHQHELRLHDALVGATGNAVLDLFATSLQVLYADRVGMEGGPRAQAIVADAHRKIAEAILAGDGNNAEALMREHLEGFLVWGRRYRPELLDELVDWR